MKCKTLKDEVFCETCEAGYFKSNNYRVMHICQKIFLPNCLDMVESPHRCLRCSDGYFLTQKGNCFPLVPNCVSFTASKCTACLPPYVLSPVGHCSLIPHCKLTSNSSCIQCDNAYYPSPLGNACLPIKNCLYSSGYDSDCDVCSQFFTRIAFVCTPVLPIVHCEEYRKE